MFKLHRAHNNYNGVSEGHKCTNPNRSDFFFIILKVLHIPAKIQTIIKHGVDQAPSASS